jgi:hypothetical protein
MTSPLPGFGPIARVMGAPLSRASSISALVARAGIGVGYDTFAQRAPLGDDR